VNRTTIEWCDWTWNPLTGCLGPDANGPCSYCYAKRFAERFSLRRDFEPGQVYMARSGLEGGEVYPYGFAPTFYPHRLDEPMKVKKPSRIFVCSMGELFGPWVPNEWVRRIFGTMQDCPWHTFILLTKWPQNILRSLQEAAGDDCPLPNVWLLTSVENQETWDKRVPELLKLREHGWPVLGVSVEPMLGPIGIDSISRWPNQITDALDWIIVGGQSPVSASQPEYKWVDDVLMGAAFCHVPIFLKNNLRPILGDNLRQEWPEEP